MNIFVYICIFLSTFFCGIILTLFFRKISISRNILLAKNGVSLAGGISIALTFLVFYCIVSLALGLKINIKIIFPSFIMLIFGVLDDWKELSVLTKFAVQIISTLILVLLGVKTKIVYIGEPANLLVTFLWIIGITNAFNHLDVLDGLAAGLAVIICAAFSIVSFSGGSFDFVFLFFAFATLGFLICNYPPARIYMGNSGSHFFGFFLAASAISINYASLDKPVALLSPILILGFPVFDTAFLSLMRIKNGRSIFKKSDDH
ncbi:undecaprenyl/decaprenyl-phosphate alpha-N-acetylglucosaminyl 1-phosphate transferase, partial [bacterium]